MIGFLAFGAGYYCAMIFLSYFHAPPWRRWAQTGFGYHLTHFLWPLWLWIEAKSYDPFFIVTRIFLVIYVAILVLLWLR
jgi:hypothetical protein